MDGGMNGVEGRGRIEKYGPKAEKGGKRKREKRESSRIKRCFTREPAAFQRVTLMQGKGWKATERDDYAD